MSRAYRSESEWRDTDSSPARGEFTDYLEEQAARKVRAEGRKAEAEANIAEAEARYVEAEAERLELKVFRQAIVLVFVVAILVMVLIELLSSPGDGAASALRLLLR